MSKQKTYTLKPNVSANTILGKGLDIGAGAMRLVALPIGTAWMVALLPETLTPKPVKTDNE